MRGVRYEFLQPIGQGNYGTLYRGVDRAATDPHDAIIAGKKLKQAGNSRSVLRELGIQRSVAACAHVVTLHDVVPRDGEKVLLVLEFLPMNLREFMNSFACVHRSAALQALREPLLPLPYTKQILKGLLTALATLHARGVAHRDVKPENILVEPLGADHPLRCCCPGPASACPVHGRWFAGDAGRDEEEEGASSSGRRHSAARLVSSSGRALLHHEMGAPELTTTICRLHCRACGAAKGRLINGSSPGENGESSRGVDTLQENKEIVPTAIGTASAANPIDLPLTPHAKLGDFGSARSVAEVKTLPWSEHGTALTGNPTTPVYCAPEMILQHTYDEAVDMWAVGAILFELVFGVLLIPMGRVASLDGTRAEVDYTDAHRLMRLVYLLGTPTAEEWRAIAPAEYGESARQALPQRAASQLFPGEGSADAFAESVPRLMGPDGAALLRALLRYNPQERLSAAAALQHPFLQ